MIELALSSEIENYLVIFCAISDPDVQVTEMDKLANLHKKALPSHYEVMKSLFAIVKKSRIGKSVRLAESGCCDRLIFCQLLS